MKSGRVIINRKICDNAPECSGIEVCPTSAMYWDDETQRVEFDSSICMDCGMCAEACPVGAIMWAEDDQGYLRILQDVENDPRTFEELSVERYGATPIEDPISPMDIPAFIEACDNKYAMIEFFDDNSVNCLLHSIRIEDIKDWFDDEVSHKKVQLADEDSLAEFEIDDLPTLVVCKNKHIIGVVSGYYDDSANQQSEMKKQILEIIKRQ